MGEERGRAPRSAGAEALGPVLTTDQVARLLHTDPSTVRRLAAAGTVPAHRVPGLKGWRFLLDEVVAWVREQPGGPAAAPDEG